MEHRGCLPECSTHRRTRPQRFTGTFSADGKIIEGRWETSRDGSSWEHDFDLTYTKVT